MFFFYLLSCGILNSKIDCTSYAIDKSTFSLWDSGSEANTGVHFSLSNTGGENFTSATSYSISTDDPGSLLNGYQIQLFVNNTNTTSGEIALFISPTPPSTDAIMNFSSETEISENINGLGELYAKLSLASNDYKNTTIEYPITQIKSDAYITLIVTEDSIIEGNLYIDKLYCEKNSGYANGETSSYLNVDEIW